MVFKVLPGFETAFATHLRALVGFVVTLVRVHMTQTLFLAIELRKAVSALGVITDVQYTQR